MSQALLSLDIMSKARLQQGRGFSSTDGLELEHFSQTLPDTQDCRLCTPVNFTGALYHDRLENNPQNKHLIQGLFPTGYIIQFVQL